MSKPPVLRVALITVKKVLLHIRLTEGEKSIIQGLLEAYGQAIQDALKELRGSTIKEMIESEMTLYFGYGKSE